MGTQRMVQDERFTVRRRDAMHRVSTWRLWAVMPVPAVGNVEA
jgi:hypothetical protein